jgi:hypothetical protein
MRQFGAILLLLVSCVAPAMACMAPDAQMTIEERTCCRIMRSRCGQMEMPTSNDCCKKALNSVQDVALKPDTSFNPSALAAMDVSSLDKLIPESWSIGRIQRPDHSPPTVPPSAIAILRI